MNTPAQPLSDEALETLHELAVNEPAEQRVDVPDSMRVHCPLADFKLRKVTHCLACPHLAGGALADRFPGANHMPIAQRYAVPCSARPTLRQMTEVE